jgi:hypothetical protein
LAKCLGNFEDVERQELSERVIELCKKIINAMSSGNGRSGRCESEDEIKQLLDLDAVDYDPEDFATALSVLEQKGAPGGLPLALFRTCLSRDTA